jgi:L-aminopeptidase/D-esterase-like protein
MRGGIGSASALAGEAAVGAIVAVNAVGDVRDPLTGALIAGTREAPDSLRLCDSAALLRSTAALPRFGTPWPPPPARTGETPATAVGESPAHFAAGQGPGPASVGEHTTIGVVATTARLSKPEAAKVAALALLGFARALSPPHTAFDGDALFVLSVGDVPADLTRLGLVASEVVAQAIARGVRAATPLPGLPAARDLGAPLPPAPGGSP